MNSTIAQDQQRAQSVRKPVGLALERVAGRRAIPPERFVGWREAADRTGVGAL